MAADQIGPFGSETLEWPTLGQGAGAAIEFEAAIPGRLGSVSLNLTPESADECAEAALEVAVLARSLHRDHGARAGAGLVLAMTETVASCQVDGLIVTVDDLAGAMAALPARRAARDAHRALDALLAHRKAAARALGLGAFAAAHTAPGAAAGGLRAVRYRDSQAWIGGSDLWPAGADYVPPQPGRVPDMMDDLVDFCARVDVDPVAQAAIAHAQILSIQPFPDANGRVARTVMSGVLCRRGFAQAPVIPVSASLRGDRRRYDAAWIAFRQGDASPMARLVARHTIAAAAEATAVVERVQALPERWLAHARPRKGSAATRLIELLSANPVVTAADVQRLTGASQASAYDAIVRLAEAGVLKRLTRGRRNTVWAAADVFGEADRLLARLGRPS